MVSLGVPPSTGVSFSTPVHMRTPTNNSLFAMRLPEIQSLHIAADNSPLYSSPPPQNLPLKKKKKRKSP